MVRFLGICWPPQDCPKCGWPCAQGLRTPTCCVLQDTQDVAVGIWRDGPLALLLGHGLRRSGWSVKAGLGMLACVASFVLSNPKSSQGVETPDRPLRGLRVSARLQRWGLLSETFSSWQAREAEFEAEQERIRREKEKEITRLRAMQERAQDHQAQQVPAQSRLPCASATPLTTPFDSLRNHPGGQRCGRGDAGYLHLNSLMRAGRSRERGRHRI